MGRLLVLWLLSEQPMYGYEIKKALTNGGMAFWFGLEDASIYSVLRTLTKNGFAKELDAEQSGNRPVRTRYSITSSGQQYYRTLLREAMTTVALPISPFDVALAARGDLGPAVVAQALDTRLASLRELEDAIDATRSAAPNTAIVERNLALVVAERTWLETLDHRTIT
jgi:DNA-binding PadR family transcriptional regulator